jgi:putative endonuclease
MTQAKHTRIHTGRIGEDRAVLFLSALGYTIHKRNWRCRIGEIDIIARDDLTWVFVEVRTRRTSHFGDAAESMTPQKVRRLQRLAQLYLAQHPQHAHDFRIDFIGITVSNSTSHIHHIQSIA